MVQPHPPREPSHDRVRPRPRVKNGSAGKNRMSSAGSTKGKNCVCEKSLDIEDLTKVVISYDIYETTLQGVS